MMEMLMKNNVDQSEIVKLILKKKLAEIKAVKKRCDAHLFYFAEEYEKAEHIDRFFTRDKKHLVLNTMLYDLCFEGVISRLTIAQPPRFGKSYTGTLAIAKMVGMRPSKPNMRNISNIESSKKLSKETQEIVETPFFQQMYGLKVNPNKRGSDIWGVVSVDPTAKIQRFPRMSYFAGSIGGKSTGNPAAGLLVLDDEYADFVAAHSAKIKKSTKEWINSAHETRAESGVSRIYACTRWANDDTIGRNHKLLKTYVIDFAKYFQLIKENMTDKEFEKVYLTLKNEVMKANEEKYELFSLSIPAVLNNHSTCEEVVTTEEYLITYKKLKNSGQLHIWSCVYQQNPISIEGLLFEQDNLNYFYPEDIAGKRPDKIIAYCDPAFGGGDYFTLLLAKIYKKKVYVTEAIYSKENAKETLRMILTLFKKNACDTLFIEKNHGGDIYADTVKDKFFEYGINVKVKKIGHYATSKEARIVSSIDDIVNNFYFYEYGYVEKNKPMYKAFLFDVLNMPAKISIADHDDGVDALAGLHEVKGKAGKIKISLF